MATPAGFPFFSGKTLHLGVCGSVAAYKAVDLMRMAQKNGLGVSVTLTEAARRFIAPLSFEALGANAVYTGMFGQEDGTCFGHLTPGEAADAFVIAPASAATLARLAGGFAGEMLAAQALAFPRPLILAPAMNPRMWNNAATRENCERLAARGHRIVSPACGKVACGDEGQGKLAPLPDILCAALRAIVAAKGCADLQDKKVLVTLGPTREPWDSVRYWSNHSTGYMGACLAQAAWLRGAEVHAVAGPGASWLPPGVQRHDVGSAAEMYEQARALWASMDVGIFTAAVADFSPKPLGRGKFKKADAGDVFTVEFTRNTDILASLAHERRPGQKVMGFAAEADDLRRHVMDKLTRKGADMIVGNLVGVPGSGFASQNNTVFVADGAGRSEEWPSMPKPDVAWRLLDWLCTL